MNTDKNSSGNKKLLTELMECPNCGGTMRREGKKWICESCDHEVPVKV